jgi:hypothetical protein
MSIRHGHCSGGKLTNIYSRWQGMLGRCECPSRKDYEHYGAKGIAVCERWHTFENFLADMGEAPEGMSLDRIDGTKGYSPDNCRWATLKEQNDNRVIERQFITHDGKTLSRRGWAAELGIGLSALRARISKGWPVVGLLPVNKGSRNPSAKLSEESVAAIKALGRTGVKARSLAKQYGTSDHNIRAILRGKVWADVEPAVGLSLTAHTPKGRERLPEIDRMLAQMFGGEL